MPRLAPRAIVCDADLLSLSLRRASQQPSSAVPSPVAPQTSATTEQASTALHTPSADQHPSCTLSPTATATRSTPVLHGDVEAARVTISDDDIRLRSYFLYLERGGQPRDPAADWLEAEQSLRAERTATP